MPTFNITAPDGKKYRVSGDNAEGAHAALMEMLGDKGSSDIGVMGTLGDMGASALSGVVRGGIGLASLPEMALRGVARGGQEILQEVGVLDEGNEIPVLETGTGKILGAVVGPLDDYESKTTFGDYAGTLGEFIGGTGALGAAGKAAKVAGKALSKTPPANVKLPATTGGKNVPSVSGDIRNVPALIDDVAVQAPSKIQQAISQGLQKQGQRFQDLGTSRGALGAAVTGAIGSETAGQLYEGTAVEPFARVVGAMAAPSAFAGIKNKTLAAFKKRSYEKPALETARDAATASYKAFDNAAKGAFIKVDDLLDRIRNARNTPEGEEMFIAYAQGMETSKFVDDALQTINQHKGKEFNLAQLDALRQGVVNIHRKSGYDPRVGFLKDEIDKMIQNAPIIGPKSSRDLLLQARLDYRRLKKMEIFEEAMGETGRAALNIAARGAGQDIANGYRQAAKNILNNQKMRGQFDKDEIEMMEAFVMGNLSQNTMRLIGKLSPTGNGLMQALNIAAIASNPAFVGGTIAGFGAKAASDRMTKASIDKIRDFIMSGVDPKSKNRITDEDIRMLMTSSASIEGG